MFQGVFQKKQRETFHSHLDVKFMPGVFFLYLIPKKFGSNDNTHNC